MSQYLLALGFQVENPYHIEQMNLSVFSIEELCYYLYHNIYLVDNTVVNEKLYFWLEKELQMKPLADQLRLLEQKENNLYDQIFYILSAVKYLNKTEEKEFKLLIQKFSTCKEAEWLKFQGDAFLRNQKYMGGICIYKRALKAEDIVQLPPLFHAKIWNNMGTAYAWMYEFEKALECFQTAYEVGGDEKIANACLQTLFFLYPKEKIVEEGKKHHFTLEQIEKAEKDFHVQREEVMEENIQRSLSGLVKEYRRSTVFQL